MLANRERNRQIEAKQGKGLHKRSAPHNHFGASVGEKIDGCELLKYAHRVIRAQNSDGTGEADLFGPDCRRGQDRFRRGIKKLHPMMLANPKGVQPNAVRTLDFVEKVAQALCWAEISPVRVSGTAATKLSIPICIFIRSCRTLKGHCELSAALKVRMGGTAQGSLSKNR